MIKVNMGFWIYILYIIYKQGEILATHATPLFWKPFVVHRGPLKILFLIKNIFQFQQNWWYYILKLEMFNVSKLTQGLINGGFLLNLISWCIGKYYNLKNATLSILLKLKFNFYETICYLIYLRYIYIYIYLQT